MFFKNEGREYVAECFEERICVGAHLFFLSTSLLFVQLLFLTVTFLKKLKKVLQLISVLKNLEVSLKTTFERFL